MASFTVDLSGLPQLESAVATLQAQQAAVPTGFTGGQVFATTVKGIPGTQNMTISQLIQRIQALLLAVQSLPQ